MKWATTSFWLLPDVARHQEPPEVCEVEVNVVGPVLVDDFELPPLFEVASDFQEDAVESAPLSTAAVVAFCTPATKPATTPVCALATLAAHLERLTLLC